MGIAFTLSPPLSLLPYPLSLWCLLNAVSVFNKLLEMWHIWCCICTRFSVQFILMAVCDDSFLSYLLFCLPSSRPCLPCWHLPVWGLWGTYAWHRTQPPNACACKHTHTKAGSPSMRSGSAAEKVTGWATIKRIRARRSFVIATRDADRELLSSVNDKSMKFPSCSHYAHTNTRT